MYSVPIAADSSEARFREIARQCIAQGLAPAQLTFISPDEPTLFATLPCSSETSAAILVPRAYADLLHDAVCHSAPDRFALLYDVLWRVVRGAHGLALNVTDPAVAR